MRQNNHNKIVDWYEVIGKWVVSILVFILALVGSNFNLGIGVIAYFVYLCFYDLEKLHNTKANIAKNGVKNG